MKDSPSCAALELQHGEDSRPLLIDLYCGLGGWAEGFLEDYDVVGFDNVRHDYGTGGYPGQLVIQDATTLHGSQLKNAAVIVASPPCTEYSYMAMPWKRAKQIARALRGQDEFPKGYKGSRTIAELNTLFDTCFRLQREASDAAGRYVPLVVENVKGAQPWVGGARWHHGSFYLWGDVPPLMPIVIRTAQKFNPDGTKHGQGSWFKVADSVNRGSQGQKVASYSDPRRNGGKGAQARKVPGLNWSKHGEPDYKAKGFNVTAAQRYREEQGTKNGNDWFGSGENCSEQRKHGSKSDSRKAASAQIAKIPFPLARHIAQVFKP